jgi:hypothetical protein
VDEEAGAPPAFLFDLMKTGQGSAKEIGQRKFFSDVAKLSRQIGYYGLAGLLDTTHALFHYSVGLLRDRFAMPGANRAQVRTADARPL